MVLMVQVSEDGARLYFFPDVDAVLDTLRSDEVDVASIAWLTAEQAEGDPMYWPRGDRAEAVFLAEVSPLRLEPAQVVTAWRASRSA
jgi:hypothetical protein